MLILSIRPYADITAYISIIENSMLRFIPSYFLPTAVSFEQYVNVLNSTLLRAYLVSVIYVTAITALHFPFALVIGLVFAKVRFKGRDTLFFLFIAAMVLPFHVTVVPLNQIFNRINLFDSPWAVILLGVFSPLGVFLFKQFISQVPDDVLEAAMIDGAGLFIIIKFIILPMIHPGLAVFFLLTIVLQWSAIEPSMALIRNEQWWPVSLRLSAMMNSNMSEIFAPGVIYALPVLLVSVGVMSLSSSNIKGTLDKTRES